ncbi:MAG: CehA/McbA family metallohydrolase [Anaerolineae bacterium]
MPEYVGVIHAHTTASDGRASFPEIIRAARRARIDFLVTTDHNCLPRHEAGYRDGVLLVVGQEIHDVERQPQCNHLLCLGVTEDLTSLAESPQALIDAVNRQNGLAFIAHPVEFAPPFTDEPAIPWVDWDIQGFHGIELWNYMSEFKAHATSLRRGLRLTYWPTSVMVGPFRETLELWDRLLQTQRTVAIGGPDAHGWELRRGPLKAVILPYPFLFRAVRTHVLLEREFVGDFAADRDAVLRAVRAGHLFIGYDAIGNTRGFEFAAYRVRTRVAEMGDAIGLEKKLRLRIRSPRRADLRLVHNGQVIRRTRGWSLNHDVVEPGVYRVEAYRRHLRHARGWVFTNPIYVE